MLKHLSRQTCPKDFPVFIISFNRLDYLCKLINWLEKNNYRNIIIVDNASTYPPLVNYLASCPHKVERIPENLGHMVVWKCGKFNDILNTSYYYVTDPDVVPTDDCPNDSAQVFFDLLQQHPYVTKVGFSLKIDDIPEHYALKNTVIAWETRFFEKIALQYHGVDIYNAEIDTTFALYRPGQQLENNNFYSAMRTGSPYTARHLPWYKNLDILSDEDKFYCKTNQGYSNWNGELSSEEFYKKYMPPPRYYPSLNKKIKKIKKIIFEKIHTLICKVH